MKEKLSLLTELIKLAKCDQELRKQEYSFLLTIAQSLDVSKEVFDQLFEQNIKFTPPESEFDRILQFHRLVLLMNIDQETAESELAYMRNIGIRLGLNPIATSKVLDAMDDYPNKIVPPERLIEIFKEHYN
jgi:uncharacterized tellurite resistance protein B-like protein